MNEFEFVPSAKFTTQEKQNIYYKYKRHQILFFATFAYILYYFTRKSVDLATNKLEQSNIIDSSQMALIGMFLAITYGLGKFLIGNIADRKSGRVIMCLGLGGSAVCNLILGGVIQVAGFKISVVHFTLLILFVTILGIFQSMGWPGQARMFSNWYSDREKPRKLSIWSIGHNFGSSLLPIIVIPIILAIDSDSKWLGLYYWIPSLFALVFLPFIIWGLRDKPQDLGLPPIEKWLGIESHQKEQKTLNWKVIFVKYILKNKFVLILAFANIFAYTLRQGISFWSLKMVKDIHDIQLKDAKLIWAMYEWGGALGGIFGAYVAAYFLKNRLAPVLILGTIITLLGTLMFQFAPYRNHAVIYGALIISGFGIYIPISMISGFAIQLTNKRAAATAAGFTGVWGYFGDAIMSKIVLNEIKMSFDWDGVFIYLYIAGFLLIISLMFLWNKNEDNKIL